MAANAEHTWNNPYFEIVASTKSYTDIFMHGVGQELYDLDESVWHEKSSKHPDIPSLNHRLDQIKKFLIDRQPYLEAWGWKD